MTQRQSNGFARDMAYSREGMSLAKAILGNYGFRDATEYEDEKCATDIVMLRSRMKQADIGVRHRRLEPLLKLRGDVLWEITVRSYRPNGIRTELEKIIDDGFCDYLLYVIPEILDTSLRSGRDTIWDMARCFCVVNLSVFREIHTKCRSSGLPFGQEKRNRDGTRFRAFDIRRLTGAVSAWKVGDDPEQPWSRSVPPAYPQGGYGERPPPPKPIYVPPPAQGGLF